MSLSTHLLIVIPFKEMEPWKSLYLSYVGKYLYLKSEGFVSIDSVKEIYSIDSVVALNKSVGRC